jgi:hypothetical protein
MIRVGHGLTLRGNGAESLSRRHQGQDWHDGAATQTRIAAREVVSLESSGSFGYDRGLESDSWEMSVQTEALPSAWPFGLIRGQRIGKMAASEAVNGKCRPRGDPPYVALALVRRWHSCTRNQVSFAALSCS